MKKVFPSAAEALKGVVKDGQLSSSQLKLSDLFTNDLNPFHGTGPT